MIFLGKDWKHCGRLKKCWFLSTSIFYFSHDNSKCFSPQVGLKIGLFGKMNEWCFKARPKLRSYCSVKDIILKNFDCKTHLYKDYVLEPYIDIASIPKFVFITISNNLHILRFQTIFAKKSTTHFTLASNKPVFLLGMGTSNRLIKYLIERPIIE